MAEGAGIAYALEHLVEGAAALAKGIYDPTLPLKATLTPITGVNVPQAHHTISVIKGRAYMFGGKTTSKDGGEELADNDMHIVILPSSGIESADYQRIKATEQAPPRRHGHSAAVVDDQIYIFGGQSEDGKLLDEQGKVWVFDTNTNKWSSHTPQGATARPEPRLQHASIASEHPQPVAIDTTAGTLPQDPPDPENIMPEPPAADSYGTLIIQGGQGAGSQQLSDMWAFDVSSKTWAELPEPPPPTSPSPSLAIVENRLYTFSTGQTSYLDLTKGSFNDRGGKGELGLTPLGPWSSLPPPSSSPDKPHPGERNSASLVPVTTGQGRNYLLLLGGQTPLGEPLQDIWSLQLKPEGMTAASFKDAARMAISKDTHEAQWDEVKYYKPHETEPKDVLIQEGQSGRGIGVRKGCATAKGSEVDGATVVIWGGVGEDGKIRGDGLMVTVDR